MIDPWELAHAAAHGAGVELRPLPGVEDADLINGVIQATWGGQRIDREVVRALAASGNVCWGAFHGSDLIGFVLGWAGVDAGGLHVHSHMLAALPDRRRRGVGYALKLAQRAQALGQQIRVARWTFDPLLARNAWLNLGKLGAVVDGFVREGGVYREVGVSAQGLESGSWRALALSDGSELRADHYVFACGPWMGSGGRDHDARRDSLPRWRSHRLRTRDQVCDC